MVDAWKRGSFKESLKAFVWAELVQEKQKYR